MITGLLLNSLMLLCGIGMGVDLGRLIAILTDDYDDDDDDDGYLVPMPGTA